MADFNIEVLNQNNVQVNINPPVQNIIQVDVPAKQIINIDKGSQGPQGPQGNPGQGIASGGLTGQVLVKASDTDYDTEWQDELVKSVNGQSGDVVLSYFDVNAPSISGDNALGTWAIDILGTAAEATHAISADSATEASHATSADSATIAGNVSGIVAIDHGGTGASTANTAFNALAPTQSSQSGKYLKTDGANTSWDQIDISTADITGILPVINGGTGASTASGARSNLSAAILGNNNDITSMSAISGGISTPDYITFDVTPETTPTVEGSLYWDAADGNQTLSLVMAGGNAIQQIGEETYYRIKATSTITEGQVVMFSGTVGASGALMGTPATGLTAQTASYVMGVATQNIAINGWGYVTSFGLVRGINTTGGSESWVDGQILYYNPLVAGGLTKNIPDAPNAKIQVCAVVYAANNGSLFVRPSFGGKLGQFEGDVQITSPSGGDALQYNAITSRWENKPVTGGVSSVNGQSGDVVLTASDVGAATSAQGLPSGGNSGQILSKNSNTNYDTIWINVPISLPSQTGHTGQYLTTDGSNASWVAINTSLINLTLTGY